MSGYFLLFCPHAACGEVIQPSDGLIRLVLLKTPIITQQRVKETTVTTPILEVELILKIYTNAFCAHIYIHTKSIYKHMDETLFKSRMEWTQHEMIMYKFNKLCNMVSNSQGIFVSLIYTLFYSQRRCRSRN